MNFVRCLVIINPAARGGWVGRNLASLERTITRHLQQAELVTTCHAGHAQALAQEAVGEGVELVVSVGGDGTHSEVANGVLTAGGAPSEIALGIVHAGTGGDFRRVIPGASSLDSCCEVIRRGSPSVVDVIRATYVDHEERQASRYVLNMATLGLGAEVVRGRAADAPETSATRLQYLVGALVALRRCRIRLIDLEIDGERLGAFEATMICVCNGTHAGGGMRFSSRGSVSDGRLEVVVMDMRSVASALGIAMSLYAGDVGARRQVREFAGRLIGIDGEPLALEADGEWVGRSPALFEVLPRALSVVGVGESAQ